MKQKRLSNGYISLILIIAVLLVDQLVKVWVKTHFYYNEELEITSWFRLHFIENNGMAFGMELGSKSLLTWFRIIAVSLFIYYLFHIRNRVDLPRGYVVCISLITAGALGNVVDCIAYGCAFDDPYPPLVAQFMPEGGGYAPLFHGKVVDMFYFPLLEWDWPSWMPWVAGDHFIFFRPIFNVADACLSVSVVVMVILYAKQLIPVEAKENGDKDTDGNVHDSEKDGYDKNSLNESK